MAIRNREQEIIEILAGQFEELSGMEIEISSDANSAYFDGYTDWHKGSLAIYVDKLEELRALAAEAKKQLERKLELK